MQTLFPLKQQLPKLAAALFVLMHPHPTFCAPPEKGTPTTTSPAPAAATRARNVTPDEAQKRIDDTDPARRPLVLDIRTPEEFADGHIKGAVNIDSFDPAFQQKLAKLDRSKPVLVHCAAGGRSGRALPAIEALHFSEVLHLQAGFNGWRDAGKPVAK
jgi:rhodanese-related sulfurtransferase